MNLVYWSVLNGLLSVHDLVKVHFFLPDVVNECQFFYHHRNKLNFYTKKKSYTYLHLIHSQGITFVLIIGWWSNKKNWKDQTFSLVKKEHRRMSNHSHRPLDRVPIVFIFVFRPIIQWPLVSIYPRPCADYLFYYYFCV